MASDWLQPRIFQKVKLYESQPVQSFKETDNGLEFSLANRRTVKADHLILATGYLTDIRRLPMLHPSLTASIHTYTGSPILNNNFETNIPGLYFAGFTSVLSCGPLYRFVVGTDAAAQQIVRAIIHSLVHV
jgi:thioredoxin reductase